MGETYYSVSNFHITLNNDLNIIKPMYALPLEGKKYSCLRHNVP
jgi:hypothetical protein